MKKVLKWIGIVLGSLIGLILLAGIVMVMIGNSRLNKTYDFPPSNITIPTDAASIERGKHRVEALCQGCHGPDLGGINQWFNAGPIGTVDSANLTSGEGGFASEATSDEDFVRAIRHGIGLDGKAIFMPAVGSTSYLSDEDLGAIIAYVKSVPPVDHVTNGHNFTPLAKILFVLGKLPNMPVETVSHEVHVTAPEAGATAEYGEYMVNTNDCRTCHGPNLNGGPFPDPTITRISPNLTPGGELSAWTEEDFITAIRTGVTPSGYKLDNEFMPWETFRNYTDDELKAIWMYLQTLPKLEQYSE